MCLTRFQSDLLNCHASGICETAGRAKAIAAVWTNAIGRG
jgi:hypothetical protein